MNVLVKSNILLFFSSFKKHLAMINTFFDDLLTKKHLHLNYCVKNDRIDNKIEGLVFLSQSIGVIL